MKMTMEIPENLVAKLSDGHGDAEQKMVASLVAGLYRTGKISRHEVGEALGLDRWGVEEFLGREDAARPYSLADWELERAGVERLTRQ